MNVIFLFFYEMSLWVIALFAIPKTLYSFFVHKKYRNSLLPRLGINYPAFAKPPLPSIWIHAVSVGETKAIVALARQLKQRFPQSPLIISSVTETGHAEAKRSLPFADYHVYLPLDFYGVVRKVLKRASPKLVVLCESDCWLNFLYNAKKRGAAIALVNGKLSMRSMRRFCFASFFSKRLFGLLDVLCVQNPLYGSRFAKIGISPGKICITGNLKLDEDYPQLSYKEALQWRQKLGIQAHQLVLTIGSTHPPEEQLFLQVLKELWATFPELRVILVPRHPELFKDVGTLLERERLSWISFTNIIRRTGKEQVILMDAMGLLRMCYQLSDMALVGGSFTDRIGGHNILEPCWYGKPVLFGPYMYTQLELVDWINQYQAGKQVNLEDLKSTLEEWMTHPQQAKEMGSKGLQLVKDLKGSTQRTLQALEPLLSQFEKQEQ